MMSARALLPSPAALCAAARTATLLLAALWAAAGALPARAQSKDADAREYMYEVGFGGGASVAYGDINTSRPLYHPAAAGQLVLRYNANPRWAVCMDVASLGLKGDARDLGNAYPGGASYRIDSRYWQLSCRPEFHFWNYGWASDYREKRRIAPFLTAGIAAGVALAEEQTSAPGVPSAGGRKSTFTFALPIGAGMKWKMAPRWNTQLTCLFTKTMSDRVDGLEDPMGIRHAALKNTDWIGSLMLSVTFDFKERCLECKNQHSF